MGVDAISELLLRLHWSEGDISERADGHCQGGRLSLKGCLPVEISVFVRMKWLEIVGRIVDAGILQLLLDLVHLQVDIV